jgi:ribosomal protein L19
MKAALLASLLLAVPTMASAQRVFDTHVHIWNGETSVRAYEAQLKETQQTATRFAGILIAERGNMVETRRIPLRTNVETAAACFNPRVETISTNRPVSGVVAVSRGA